MDSDPNNWYPEPVPMWNLQTPTIFVPPSPTLVNPPLSPPPHFLSHSIPPFQSPTFIPNPAAVQSCIDAFTVFQQGMNEASNDFRENMQKIQESLQQSRRLIRELRTKVPTASAASSSGPHYAPEDPTLPSPWRGLIDGTTGSVYFWNTATNQTQYEKPWPLTHPTQPIYLHRKQLRVLRRRVSMAATRQLVKDTRKPDLLSRVGKYSGSKLNRKHGLWAVKAQNGEVYSDIMEAIRQHCVGTETSPTNPSFSPLISDVTEQHAVLFSVAVADEISLASPKPTNDDAVVPTVTSTGAALAYAHELDPVLVCRNLLPSVTEYDPSPLSLASDRAEDSVDLCYASFTSRTDVVVDVSNAATAIESKLTDIVELHETEAVDKQGFISGEEDPCSDSFIVQQVTDEFYKQEFGMVIRFYNLGNSDISTRFDSTHIYNGFINVGIGDHFSTGDGLCKPGLLFGDCELFHDEDPMLKVHEDGAIVTHTRFPQLLLAADNFNSEIIEFAVLTDDYCYGKLRVPQSAWFENIQWSHAQVGDTYSMCLRSVETLVSGARAPLQCPPSSVVKIDGRLLLALLDSIVIAEKSETRSSGKPALNSVNCLRTDQLMWPISSVAGFVACPYVPLYVTLPPGILNSYCNLVEVLASSFANCHCLRPACTLLLKNWAQYNYPYNAISYHPSWEAVENDNAFNEAWFENSMMNTNMLEDHEKSAIVHQFFLFLLHTKKLFSHRGMPSALETKWVVGTLVAVFRNVKLSVRFFIERKEPYTQCFRDFFLSPLFSALYGTLNLLAFESFAPSMVTAVLAAALYHTFLSMCPYLADIAYPDHDIAICEQTTSSTTWKPVSGTCSSLFTVYSYGGKLSKTETASMTYEAVGVPANLVLSSQRLMKLVFLAGVLQLVIGLPSSPCSECQRVTALLLGQSVWSVSFFTISFPSFLLDAENFSLKLMTTGTTPKAQLLKQQFSLGVSEANLESHMLEVTKMEFVLGLLSGVQLLFDRFIKTLKPEDLVKATVGGEFLTTSGTTHIQVLVETALPLKLGRHLSPRIIEFEVLAAPYRIFGVESNNRAPHYVAFIQKLLSARRRVISNVECGKLLMDLSHVLICYLTYFQVGDYCEMGITLAGKDQFLYTWGKLTRYLSYFIELLKFGRCYMSEVMFASTAQYLVTLQQDDIYSSTWLNKDQVAWSKFVHEFAKGYYKVPSLTNSLDMVFHNKLMYLFEFVAYAPSDRLIGAKSEVVGYHSQQRISSLGFITSISNPIHIILQCSQVVMPKLITVLSKAILLTDYDVIEVPASNLYLVEVVLRFSCHTDLLNQPGRFYVHGFEEFLQLNSEFSCLSVPVHVVGQTKGENADTSNWQMVEYVSDKQQSEECGLKLRFYSALIAAFWNSTLIAAFWWLGLNQSDKLCIFPATHALSTPKKLLPKGCSYTKILDHTCSFSVHCKA